MDRDRGVTDWYATIVFTAMFVSTFLLWCCAFAYGQPAVATHGMAWNGNICGRGATADAPQQVWINPTMSSSIFASSVCMPSCPVINSTAVVHNDTATADLIEDGINQIGNSAEKKSAQKALNKLERRVDTLKTEMSYLN